MSAACLALVAGGCADDVVRLAYRPGAGERSTYRIEVRAVAVTTIDGERPRRTVADSVLRADHRVLESGEGGSRVEVRLREEGGGPATVFVVRFDPAGRPAEVQRTHGPPGGAIGDLGLSEIFPAAAAVPPDRPLEPGDRWVIDEPAAHGSAPAAGPPSGPARVRGVGRLVALQVDDGRRLARVESSYRTPVRRTAGDAGGSLLLDGSLRTRADVAYDLDDDVVHSVRARTRGRYDVTVLPPTGVAGSAVPGTLDVDLQSTTRRLR